MNIGEDPALTEERAESVICMNSEIEIFKNYEEKYICQKRCQKDCLFKLLVIRILLEDQSGRINKHNRKDHIYECIRSRIDKKENKASRKEKHPLKFLREVPIDEQQNRREYEKFY